LLNFFNSWRITLKYPKIACFELTYDDSETPK